MRAGKDSANNNGESLCALDTKQQSVCPLCTTMDKTALFTNFSSEPFTGYWNGTGKTFQPGQSLYMPDGLARHFAKHLVNRELLRRDANGNLIYKDGEKFTSPKKPEDVPLFMELFNKAYTPDESSDDVGDNKQDIDALINSANKNREKRLKEKEAIKQEASKQPDPSQPQVVLPPDLDDEDEESFEGKPLEDKN